MEFGRDLVIIISGSVVTVVAVLVAVLCYLLYRNIRATTRSLKTASARIEALTNFVTEEAARPLVQITAMIQGMTQGIHAVKKIFGKEGG